MIHLNGTYTWTEADGHQTTVTTKVRDKQSPEGRIITIRGLAPMLADVIDAIDDEGDRVHTLTVLSGAVITLRDHPTQFAAGVTIHTRDEGRIATTYTGTRHLPVDVVLDLAEALHAQLIRGEG